MPQPQGAVVDEEDLRLRSAVKSEDGFFTTFFVSPYSKYIARWCARHRIRPNTVTVVSIVLGLGAAGLFATGERYGLIAGAVVLQVAFTADCVDGQLARYTRDFSVFGGWLDAMGDRVKEYVVYAGLAVGADRAGLEHAWQLAIAAIALQTVRHMADFAFAQKYLPLISYDAPGGLNDLEGIAAPAPVDGSAETGSAPVRASLPAWLSRLTKIGTIRWMHKIVGFPIGERFAAVSVAAAVTDARVVFVVLLAMGGWALTYSTGHRLVRALL